MGQTLAVYGMGNGPYLVLPVLGPSSARDGIGLIGNAFLRPVTYIYGFDTLIAIKATEVVNENSLDIDQYDRLKRRSLDPYTAFKDGYVQYRREKIKE